ncbi:hypothetical protein EDD17DRAFT_1184913 [Pisolithus thermaeus]|nr:hypothetical protein EDD17DRAFT_1184913 [Pisolithus thermaeus]
MDTHPPEAEPMDGQEGPPSQHDVPPMSEGTQEYSAILKRRSEEGWMQGHHAAKSSKANVTSIAPREERLNPEEAEARASQLNLLNSLQQFMFRQPLSTADPTVPYSDSSRGSTPTTYSSCVRTSPVSQQQSPALSSSVLPDVEPSISSSNNSQPLQQATSIQAILDAQRLGLLLPSIPPDNREQSTTPSSDTTQRPRRPSRIRQPTNTQAIPDARQRHPGTVRGKGKEKSAEIQPPQRVFHFQDPTLPRWPSVVVNPNIIRPAIANPNVRVPSGLDGPVPNANSNASHDVPISSMPSMNANPNTGHDVPMSSGPSTQHGEPNAFSNPFPNWSAQSNANPSGPGDVLAPMLSYISQGLDTLLHSIQASQTTNYHALMKEVNDLRQQLNTTNAASDAQPDAASGILRKIRTQYKFISSNPYSPPTKKEKREHYAFMNCIRVHTLTLLGIASYRHLRTVKCSLSQREVDDFEKDIPGCLVITPANFMVDCLRPRNSPFNRNAANVFTEDFLDKVVNHSWYAKADIPIWYREYEAVYDGFMSHLTTVKSHFKELLAEEEDQAKAKQRKDLRLQRSARNSRKIRLFKLRLDTIANDASLKRHLAFVKGLGSQGMSSDESEDENTRTISYPRVYPAWRSGQLASLLWKADDVAATNVSVQIGKRKKSGTQLRIRPHTDKVNEEAAAPPGLPHNCYDATWLGKLSQRQRRELRVQDAEYDFTT